MADTNQAPNLEGIHHKMHGIAEQIKVMNKMNVWLVQHLTMNNPTPATMPVPKDTNRYRHSHWLGILQGAIIANPSVFTPNMEGE